MLTTFIIVIPLQGIHTSKSLCGTQANTMLYVNYVLIKLEEKRKIQILLSFRFFLFKKLFYIEL